MKTVLLYNCSIYIQLNRDTAKIPFCAPMPSLTKTTQIIGILLGEIQEIIKTLHFIPKAVPKLASALLQNGCHKSLRLRDTRALAVQRNVYLSSLTKNLWYEEREQLDSGGGGALSKGAGHDGSFYRYAV